MNPLHKIINGKKHYLSPPDKYLPCLTQEEIDVMWPNAAPVYRCGACGSQGPKGSWCEKCYRNTPEAERKDTRVVSTKKEWREEDSKLTNAARELLTPEGDLTDIPDAGKPVDPIELEQVMSILSAPERLDTETANVVLPHHYARFKIEPIRFSIENNLNGFQFNIIKYILRHDAKNGIEDLKKARRYLEMFIKFMEGDEDWWR